MIYFEMQLNVFKFIANYMMGNINTLKRSTGSTTLTDDLVYTYSGTNQLQSIVDNTSSIIGLLPGVWNYTYDGNGNLKNSTYVPDGTKSKNITAYNILNLPQTGTAAGTAFTFTYDAGGQKLRKVSGTTTTDYVSGIQYAGTTTTPPAISFIQTEEGRAVLNGTSYNYEYALTDHLGNSRVNFATSSGTAVAVQVDDYYAFGMEINRTPPVPSLKNEYLYNKKELQEELGQYDYGARFYDPVVSRFTTIDPLAEHFPWMTSYQYGSNNPSSKKDLDGLEGIFPFELFEETGFKVGPLENIAKAGGDIAKAGDEVSKSQANQNRVANTSRGAKTETEQLKNNGLEKNTRPIKEVDPKTGKEGETVPDALKENGKKSVEIKDVKEQSLTKQLRLQKKFSNDNGFKPELLINETAKLSKPLQNSGFEIKFYQSSTVTLKVDAVKVVPSNIKPPDPPPLPPGWI